MTTEKLRKSLQTYYGIWKAHGRVTDRRIKPEEAIIKRESKFFKYLNDEDLICMFCYQPLQIIAIDWTRQRPVWGCLKDRFTKGMQTIHWLDHCADCGKKLNLDEEQLKDQAKYLDRDNVNHVCDKCLGTGNIITDDDFAEGKVHKKTLLN